MDETLVIPPCVLDGNWFIVEGEVNLNDLMGCRKSGRIVRMKYPDSIRYIPSPNDNFDRIAGMVSDSD